MASLYELTGDFLKVREMLFDEDAILHFAHIEERGTNLSIK